MKELTVWYNPVTDEIGCLSIGGTFLMRSANFFLGNRAGQRLAGAKWVKIGSFTI